MRRSNVRGSGADGRPDRAGELGWDDSLYEDAGAPGMPRQRGYARHTGDHGPHHDDAHEGPGPEARSESHAEGPGDGGPPPRRRRGARIARWFFGIVAFLILGTAAAGYLYYRDLNNNLEKDPLNLGKNKLDEKQPNAEGQTPLDILLLGSDSRNSDENVRLGGSRADRGRKPLADVQMLLHVSADRSNMSVVSVPRDTRVTIPECTDPDDGTVYPETTTQTINTSLQHGGPGCTVAAWEAMTGVSIDHFMMIDFAGVVSMADAVGGVPVCVRDNVYDDDSGLRLEEGETTIKGEQALQWLRTRHGFEDGSDIGRTHAQHQYMNSMARQLKEGAKLSDPGKLRRLAEAATNALHVDDGLGDLKKLYDLGNDIKRVPPERITMTTMPWVPDPQNNAHVVPNEQDASQIWSMIRNDVAFDGKDKPKKKKPDDLVAQAEPKADIPVLVQNGTGTTMYAPVTGRAGDIAEVLATDGFTQAATDATPKSQADTTISYATEEQHANALAVAKAIGLPDRAVKESSGVDGVTLVVGADWREGDAYPPDAGGDAADGGEEAGPEKAPESSNPLAGSDKKACMDVNPSYTW
ncbi:LCP family protein [Streptomyces sp. NBC_01808]|uniref:LCP family protein n=1 Tax=Streptomyces sp. NBC_01808 TaxID=2975947 RepID=UPI002DDC6B69|nr:LCP family protein [Streptomyces sp. NBC_01808]WSA38156.1 LCP family protein [Streptomyces sp. NBC_01808]